MVFRVFFAQFLMEMASNTINVSNDNIKKLKLSRRYRPARGRIHYLLVKIEDKMAIPILKASGAISSLAEADGFIEISKNIEILEKGDLVQVYPLTDF